MILELDLQSPYTPTGEPQQDLPTGEVLAWDGEYWIAGKLRVVSDRVDCFERYGVSIGQEITLHNVLRFAPLPTIYEDDTTTL